jgi:formylglycine-generating enzyme required for sulfatase activity
MSRRFLQILLAALLCLSIQCGKDTGTNPNDETTKIPASTKPVARDAVVSVTDTTCTLSKQNLDKQLKVNDLLVSEYGQGLLRRIASVRETATEVVVETMPAALTDAIEKCDLQLTRTLTPKDLRQVKQMAPGVRFGPSPSGRGEFFVELDDVVIYDGDGNPDTQSDQVVLSGELTLQLTLEFHIRIDNFTLKELKIAGSFKDTLKVDMETSVDVLSLDEKKEIASFDLNPIVVWVGPVPVVITPEMAIVVGVSGDVSLGITVGMEQHTCLKAGLQFRDGNWEPIHEVMCDFEWNPPRFLAAAEAKGYAGPQLNFLLYGVAGPYVNTKGYIEFQVDLFDDPWWVIYGGIEASAGAKMEILDHDIADHEIPDVIGYRIMLAQAPGPANTAPTASFTVTPSTGTTSTNFQFDASGSSDAEDPVSALQVRWNWENDGVWDTDWSTTKTANHQYGTTGTKTIRLEAKDTGGLTDDTTRTVTVIGTGPVPGEMVLVPAGNFTMGDGVASCGLSQHQVTLTHSFYLGKYEVTNQEYRDALQWAYGCGYVTATLDTVRDNLDGSTVMLVHLGSVLPGQTECQVSFSGGVFTVDSGKENHPMTNVSWYGAAAYCDWLSMSEGLGRAYNHSTWQCNSGNPYGASGYRLPTDAEWEYAARYNDGRIYPWGDESPDCSRANYCGCVGSTAAVGSFPAGATSLGLYDMAGNVLQYCNDWWICDLGTSSQSNPTGPPEPPPYPFRVMHGGSWLEFYDDNLRCAGRLLTYPPLADFDFGFRCARSH